MNLPDALQRLRTALHPLDAVPDGAGWNHEELSGLLRAGPSMAPMAAAVLVGLVPRPEGIQVLLSRRNEVMRHHPGQVSFPGGRIEDSDADPAAAAIREAGEEVGLLPAQIVPMGYLDPLLTVTGFRILPLVAAITPDYIACPDPREVAEVFEVPLDYLLAPESLRHIEIGVSTGDGSGRPRSVLEFVDRGVEGQRIWGATASILFNFRQRLGGMQ